MQLTQQTDNLKTQILDRLDQLFGELKASVKEAIAQHSPIHEVEEDVWKKLLAFGHEVLSRFVEQQGTGDLGPTLRLPDGRTCQRLQGLQDRRYVSVFGEIKIARTVYGTRKGQKIDFVPLDNRLQLPRSPFSYLLQDWDQGFCVDQPYTSAATNILRILGLKQSVSSLEQMNAHMARGVEQFRENRAMPQPTEEGEILVLGADGKGIVMRPDGPGTAPKAHRGKGDKASRKRMAIVGVAYSVDRHARTPEEVVAALFREGDCHPSPGRPAPRHKHVWASLSCEETSAVDRVYPWLLNEAVERNRGWGREMVCLHDGQPSLWEARDRYLPKSNTTDILDLLHVTPRLWQLAHLFCKEGSEAAEQFVRSRLLKVLKGQVRLVVRGVRQMATKRKLGAGPKRTLNRICQYFENNEERMRYAEYLKKGYPIATGVIEGACRHFVKDRMERAGMHWTRKGAQAMLDLRSVWINGDWQQYQKIYQKSETNRMYPHRHIIQDVQFMMTA